MHDRLEERPKVVLAFIVYSSKFSFIRFVSFIKDFFLGTTLSHSKYPGKAQNFSSILTPKQLTDKQAKTKVPQNITIFFEKETLNYRDRIVFVQQ